MSGAELHIMQQRMRQGVLAKARRGELAIAVPTGYVRRPGVNAGNEEVALPQVVWRATSGV